ncbi:uncharacterized protein TNCV_5060211 [Trichonephila clavipes]|nr:uncharacterized protein TNCV_5060211 [Trichonephila clavipes]
MTVSRVCNSWFQSSNTENRAGLQRFPITSSRESRHVYHMTLRDPAAMLRALIQELESFARQVSARKESSVSGPSVRRPRLWLLLPLHQWLEPYTPRSFLVRIGGKLDIARYISDVIRPVALPFIRVLRNPTFQQDNA